MSNEKVFVYGTLKNARFREDIIGREAKGRRASVKGYDLERIWIDGESYRCAVEGKGTIDGVVFNATERELGILDDFETDAYKRIHVTTTRGMAWMYVKKML